MERSARVPEAVLTMLAGDCTAIAVFTVLAMHADPRGYAEPKQAAIAAILGVSAPTVRRALGRLETAGAVGKEPRTERGRKVGNRYRIGPDGSATSARSVRPHESATSARSAEVPPARDPLGPTKVPPARDPHAREPSPKEEVTSNRNRADDAAQAPLAGMPPKPKSQRAADPLVAEAHELVTRVFGNRVPKPLPSFLNVRALAERALRSGWQATAVEAVMMLPDTVFTTAGLETARAKASNGRAKRGTSGAQRFYERHRGGA